MLVLVQDCLSPQLLSAFPNSTTGVSCFCPLVGCKYLHLTLSAACWVFQRAVMIDPFLWELHSLSNSVRPWDLHLSWISLWACCTTFFLSGSLHFHPCNSFRQEQLWVRDVTVGWQPHSSTWCPVFLLGVYSTSSLSPLLGISSKVPPFESWESLTSQVSGAFYSILETSYFLSLPI